MLIKNEIAIVVSGYFWRSLINKLMRPRQIQQAGPRVMNMIETMRLTCACFLAKMRKERPVKSHRAKKMF
jgi:hypothetical protein